MWQAVVCFSPCTYGPPAALGLRTFLSPAAFGLKCIGLLAIDHVKLHLTLLLVALVVNGTLLHCNSCVCRWYEEHAHSCWPNPAQRPTLEETKRHAKGLRPIGEKGCPVTLLYPLLVPLLQLTATSQWTDTTEPLACRRHQRVFQALQRADTEARPPGGYLPCWADVGMSWPRLV